MHIGEYVPVPGNYIDPKGVRMFTWDYYILDAYYANAWDSDGCLIYTQFS